MTPDFSPTIDIGAEPMWLRVPALTTLQVNQWYVGWRCTACHWPAALFADPSAGAIKMRVANRSCVFFRCPLCSAIAVGVASKPIQFRFDGSMRRLVLADRHVREGEARIARTLKVINAMSLRGRDTDQAESLLDTLLSAQRNLRWHRSMLVQELLDGPARRPVLLPRRALSSERAQPATAH